LPRDSAKLTSKKPSSDRYGWVLTISVIFHLIIILGISFILPSQAKNQRLSPPLKITLVASGSEKLNNDAEMLAQTNSEGGDDPSALPLLPDTLVSGSTSDTATKQDRLLLEEQARALYNPKKSNPDNEPYAGQNLPASIDRQQLTDSINLAYLNSQAKPRERFVGADARASEIAPYLENWRILVERVGNLNYPDAARQLKIEGDLVMDVALRSDGTVAGVTILRSSGHKILDDGAERIVLIAAPFTPFSEQMKRDYDTLHIIRTWQFNHNKIRDVTD
jgi:protein TonB